MKASTASTGLSAMMIMAALSIPACAGDWDLDWDIHRYHATKHHRPHYRIPEHQREVHYYRDPELIMRRGDDELGRGDRDRDDVGKCLDHPVRGLGTQWIGTEGALQAAQKDWMEHVKYDHGESYVDMGHSLNFESRCGRVSVGEVIGQVTYRCEIVATPCKGAFKEGEGQTKGIAREEVPAQQQR